ncbi:hypothetical protein BDB00DRAFT_850222 [Zychaea mexicana]|uniref:uncharacterized protein n=1 Tax=Zychaea mexicana TaxID=64656 RepID=UPI0022FE95F2|nr:uncharacterized protein BDB00DRAFT_850222 [Zychaea mexicana]KAI9488075.1 hypothetical protein BDB00DRAFT_850222 [Zychaea mexicana]
MASQVAGYTVLQSTNLNFSVDEAIVQANRSGTFLAEMLRMLEPQQVKSNETVKDTYNECLKLREFMSEKLWAVSDNERITSMQASVESLQTVCTQYEALKKCADDEEGDW